MSQAQIFTILAVIAGVMAVLPVVYFDYRRTRLKKRNDRRGILNPDVMLSADRRKSDDPHVLDLTTYPSEAEGLSSLAALKELSPCAIANLAALGYDEIEALTNGLPAGLPIAPHEGPSFTEDELGARGYVAVIPSQMPEDDRSWAVLTDSGRQLARILTVGGASPQWLWDASQTPSGGD